LNSTTKHKEKLLLVYVKRATFVKRDEKILSKHYKITNYHFNTDKKWYLPFAFVKQFFYLLINGFRFNRIVVQSAGYVSFLPVIFSKIYPFKTVIIAIGTDCAKLPEINYGAFTKPVLAWFTAFSFKHCTLILPVHKSLAKSIYTYMNVQFKKQGILNLVKNCKTPITEVVNGYDTQKWQITNEKRIENSFLTVTFALDEIGYYRKGIDLVIAMAKQFSDYHFTIVGKVFLKEKAPKNITFIENVPQKELLKIYNQHQYYFQLSMFEGFPNALCEAMLCGCIPIGSNVAGIPDIIGNAGYILMKKQVSDLKKILSNLSKNTITPNLAREQIVANFPYKRRETELLEIVSVCKKTH
jgi:glycosyltransferase involved in cell wall biosynthesis